MPVMDGIEATRRVKQFKPKLPVVIMTAYSSVTSAAEALEAGASDYLTKPLDFKALKTVMERVLK
jgi:two-component system response regulator HydG